MRTTRRRPGRSKAHGNATAAARWLRARFDRLSPRLSVRRPDFGAVLREMAAAGITHGGGAPPAPLTEATLRKMWRRVRDDLAAEARDAAPAVAAVRAAKPERPWVPEPARTAAPARDGVPPRTGSVAAAEGESSVDRVWRWMEKRSGRA